MAPLDSGAGLNGAGGQGAAGRVRISGASSTITGTIDAGSRFEDVTYPECVWDDDTIYDVQDGTIGSDEATVLRDIVVTGVSGSGFYGQEADGGEYSGVYVYTTSGLDLDIALGDRVSVWGTTTEYNGLTEVLPTFAMWHGAGDPLDPEMITPADLSADFEPWEGVLVGLDSVTVDNPDLGFGEFSVDEGVRVDDQLYRWHDTYTLSTGDTFTGLYGVLNYTFGDYKIEPRSADDMVGYVAVE